jgi:hypothetical protein
MVCQSLKTNPHLWKCLLNFQAFYILY